MYRVKPHPLVPKHCTSFPSSRLGTHCREAPPRLRSRKNAFRTSWQLVPRRASCQLAPPPGRVGGLRKAARSLYFIFCSKTNPGGRIASMVDTMMIDIRSLAGRARGLRRRHRAAVPQRPGPGQDPVSQPARSHRGPARRSSRPPPAPQAKKLAPQARHRQLLPRPPERRRSST